jgi:hypothetical protein
MDALTYPLTHAFTRRGPCAALVAGLSWGRILGRRLPADGACRPGAPGPQSRRHLLEEQAFISGWACQRGQKQSVLIHIYAGATPAADTTRGMFFGSSAHRAGLFAGGFETWFETRPYINPDPIHDMLLIYQCKRRPEFDY